MQGVINLSFTASCSLRCGSNPQRKARNRFCCSRISSTGTQIPSQYHFPTPSHPRELSRVELRIYGPLLVPRVPLSAVIVSLCLLSSPKSDFSFTPPPLAQHSLALGFNLCELLLPRDLSLDIPSKIPALLCRTSRACPGSVGPPFCTPKIKNLGMVGLERAVKLIQSQGQGHPLEETLKFEFQLFKTLGSL